MTTNNEKKHNKYDRNRFILFRLKPFQKLCSWHYFLY